MKRSTADEHYEEEFEFPLWKMTKQRAEEKDISYLQAAWEVLPEYGKGIRYRDEKFEDECINYRKVETNEQAEFCKLNHLTPEAKPSKSQWTLTRAWLRRSK